MPAAVERQACLRRIPFQWIAEQQHAHLRMHGQRRPARRRDCRDAGGIGEHEKPRPGLEQPARMLQRDIQAGIVGWWRSEEHTSELQSLMRISYAGFCLKKKKN